MLLERKVGRLCTDSPNKIIHSLPKQENKRSIKLRKGTTQIQQNNEVSFERLLNKTRATSKLTNYNYGYGQCVFIFPYHSLCFFCPLCHSEEDYRSEKERLSSGEK